MLCVGKLDSLKRCGCVRCVCYSGVAMPTSFGCLWDEAWKCSTVTFWASCAILGQEREMFIVLETQSLEAPSALHEESTFSKKGLALWWGVPPTAEQTIFARRLYILLCLNPVCWFRRFYHHGIDTTASSSRLSPQVADMHHTRYRSIRSCELFLFVHAADSLHHACAPLASVSF